MRTTLVAMSQISYIKLVENEALFLTLHSSTPIQRQQQDKNPKYVGVRTIQIVRSSSSPTNWHSDDGVAPSRRPPEVDFFMDAGW